MIKNYFYITLLLGFFFSVSTFAQDGKQNSKLQETAVIEGLSLYPNPVTNGKVYITSKNDLNKNKKMLQYFFIFSSHICQCNKNIIRYQLISKI